MEPDEFAVERSGEALVYQPIVGNWETTALPALVEWLGRHGIDHVRVPLPSRAVLADGMLTVELFEVDEDGCHIVDPADDTRAARTTHTVPLAADPPDCWVRREVGTGGTA